MSSKYSPSRTPRKTPPWCKPGMYPVTPPIVDGHPTWLTSYLHWKDYYPGHLCDVSASLRLLWDATEERWAAHETGDHWNVGGLVYSSGSPNTYTLEIELYEDGEYSEGHEWPGIQMGPAFPWNSGLQLLVTVPGIDILEMRVMA